jgi:opine dehydrogenase
MIMQPTVSIVGAGPAGFALAADLQSLGKRVLLYSHPTHQRHAKDVKSNGKLRARGVLRGSAKVHITSDMAEVVAFSPIIILTVPSTGQETVLQELRKYSLHQHAIIAIPGNLFSSIAGMDVGCILETNLSPYSCRMEEGGLTVMGKKEVIFIAPLQRDLSPAIYETIENIFPTELKWCSSIIEVCLSNINGVFHPLMMLMNAGRIEDTAGDFNLYSDGLTPAVANAMLAIDRVRIQIGAALGLSLRSAVDVSNECYGANYTDLVDLARNSPPHNKLKAPSDLSNRNISEDVPDLLVPWYCLAEVLGIDAAPIKAVIVLAEMTTGVDYMSTGRNLRRLNLEGVTREDLIERFGAVVSVVPEKMLLPDQMMMTSSRL